MNHLILFIMMIVCISCSHYKAQAPKGFAVYDSSQEFKALNAKGVVFRVKEVENKPYAPLSFWQEAVSNRMISEGYLPISHESILIQDQKSMYFEWGAPVGAEDYLYLTAIIPTKERIFLVEAAGQSAEYLLEKQNILDAIQKLKIEL